MNSSQNNQDILRTRIRARLRAPENKLPPALRRLADALWNPPADARSHQACLAALPQFVDAEIVGERVAELYPQVKHHLDGCDSCSAEYAELLDGAVAEQKGLLPTPQTMPSPDLSFLSPPPSAPVPTPSVSLRELVLEWARALIARLAPGEQGDLSALAETFFTRAQLPPSLELRPHTAREEELGYRYTSPALLILSAAYATTQMLCNEITLTQLELWSNQGTLQLELEARAAATAQRLGIEPAPALDFATAYAAQASRDLAPLKALIAGEQKARDNK